MKNLFKTTTILIFGTLALSTSIFAGTKELAAKSLETREVKELAQSDLEAFKDLANSTSDANIYFYNVEGKLLFETKLSEIENQNTQKLIKKSDFLAEMNGSQYFVLSAL